MFTIRAVVLDYYLCKPIEEYNTKIQSLFEAEPVLRIFGSTADGLKSCVHIHGVYPYIYVPYIGGENPDRDALLLGAALDEALKANTKKQNYKFIYNVSLVSGIPLYGYHSKHRQFFKVFFYNPYYIKQASELLLSGAIFGQKLQPHEAHIPFVLQFMMDYDIYGMSFVTFSKIKYRRNLENPDFLKGVNEADIFSNRVQKITCSNLEVDALASDIVNKINSKVLDVNPGLRAIWEEEKNRIRKLSRQFPTDFEESPPRMIENAESAVESIYKELLRKKLERIRNEEESTLSGETKHSYPAEAPEGGSFVAASEAGNPEEQSLIEGDVPDIRNLINEHILTQISAGKTEVTDSENEEERMEADSVLGRDRGVEEEEELEDEAAEDLTQPLDADENFLLRPDANRDEPGTSCSDGEKHFWKVMAEKIFQFDGAQDSSSESDRDSTREKAFYSYNPDKEELKSRIVVGATPSRSSSAETLDPEANWSSNIMSILNEDTICPTPPGICQTPQSFWSSYSPKIDPWLSQNHDSWIFNKSETPAADCFSSESQTNNSSNFSAAPPNDASYNAKGNGTCLNFSFSNGEVNSEKNSCSEVTKNSFTVGGAICSGISTEEVPRQISFAVDDFSDETPNILSCFEPEKPFSFSSRDDRSNTNIVSSPRHHRIYKALENDEDKVTNIFKTFSTSSKKSSSSANEEKVISLTLKQYIKDCSEIVNVDFKNLCNRDMVVIEYKTLQGKSGQSKFLIKPLDKFLERWDSAEKKINSKLSKNFEKNLEKFNKTIASKEDEAVNSTGDLFEHKCTDDWLESAEVTSVRNKFLVKSVEMVADGGDVLNVHDAKSYKINENVISRGKIRMKIIKSQQENLEKDAFKCVKKKKIMIAKSQNYSKKKTTDIVKNRKGEKKDFPKMLDVESERNILKPARSGKRKKLNFREDFAKDWERRKENKNMSAFEAKLINQINSSFEEYFKNIVKLNRCRGRSENSGGESKEKEEKKRRMKFSSSRSSGKTSRASGGRRKAGEGSRSSWSSVDPVEVVTRFLSTYSRMSRPAETPPPPLSITISLGGGNGAAPAPIQLNFQPVVAGTTPRKEEKRRERKNKGKLKIENVDGAADGSSEDSANGDSRPRPFVGQKRMKRDGFYKPLNVVVRSGGSRRKKIKASADGDREMVRNPTKEDFFFASRVMPESLPGPSRKSKIDDVDFTDPSSCDKQDKSSTEGYEGEARQNTESESDFIYDSDEKSNTGLTTVKNKTKFRRKILRKKKRSLVGSASSSVIKAPVNLPDSKSVNAIERCEAVNADLADEKNSNSEVSRFRSEKRIAELKKRSVLTDGNTKDVDKIREDCDKNFQSRFGSNSEKLSSEDQNSDLSQISFADDFICLPQAKRFLSLSHSPLPSEEKMAKSERATDSRLANDVPIAAESQQIKAKNSVSLRSQPSSYNFRYNIADEDAFLLPFASGGNINSFESFALECFNKKFEASKNQLFSAELSESSLIGSKVAHKSNRVTEAESACNSRAIYPQLRPPSKNRVDEFLREREIFSTTATTPFYGDFRDLTKAMETGPRILKISTRSIAGLKSHETAAGISGVEERRGRLLQWENARCLFPYGKKSTVTPLIKPPSWVNATEWLKSKGRPKVKPKDRIKLVRPLSLGRESDSDAEAEQNMSINFVEEEVGESLAEGTSFENASSNYSKPEPSIVRKKTFSGKPSPKGPSSKGKGIGELNRLEAVDEDKEMAPERSSSAGSDNGRALKEVWRRSLDNSFQIRGVTCDDTLGFQESVENFNFRHTYQHVSIMEMELHIQTRKDLRPDPRCDPVRALFYVIKFDSPDREQETGIVVVGDGLLSGTGISNEGVRYVANEVALFEKTVELLKTWDPDILAGYEIEMLSWGYFIQRGFVLEMNLFDLLGRVRNESFGCKNPSDFVGNCIPEGDDFDDAPRSVRHMRISGRIVLDIWRVLRHEVVLTSYTFENVMYHLCHERHPLLSHEKLSFYWEHSSHRYRHIAVTHYLTRVVGVIRLLDQLDFINRTSELSRLFGIQFYEVLSRGSQYRVESMMLRLAKPLNYIPASPSVTQRAAMRAPASLPLVMEPESVFYTEPVIVLDFQSLYPSMIIAYNYCFSTCLGRIENLGGYEPFEFGCSQLQISPEELKKLENNITISPAGVAFVKPTVRKGILPTMLEAILDTRLMVKKSMKETKDNKTLQKLLFARQLGLKLIANVTYGYTAANFSGRMPCVEVGDSVVSKGRETLERAIKLIKSTPEWKAKVVYGDTDSIFVLTPGRTMQESFKIGVQIAEAVTQSNPKPVKLKLEKVYQPCILQTKKRYVGYMYESPDQKEPVFEAKGIETVRRDGCPAAGKILRKALQILFDTKDVSLVKKYAVRQFTKIFQGKVNIQDLIFAKEYRGRKGYRPGACVPALELAKQWTVRDRRAEPRVRERVPYVIANGPPGVPLIRLVRSPKDFLADPSLRPNAAYYITKAVIPPLQRCLSLLGADVVSWYSEMPRKFHKTFKSESVEPQRKKTISQYFPTVDCIVCSKTTNNFLCSECETAPRKIAVHLGEKIRRLERCYAGVLKICQSCCGRTSELECLCLDCPVLFRRSQAAREFDQATALREIIQRHI